MTTGADTTLSSPDDHAFFGHPRGLFVCFATELWERFSFYGMKFLLLLYLTKYHLFSDANGLEVLGGYAALVYAMPVSRRATRENRLFATRVHCRCSTSRWR
jgi:dipeptide/tripeptide permease